MHLIQISSVFHPCPFRLQDLNPWYPPCCLKLSCLIGPLWSGTTQPLLLLTLWRTDQVFCRLTSNFGCLIVFLWIGGNTQRCNACLITLYCDVSRNWLVVILVTWWSWYLLGLCFVMWQLSLLLVWFLEVINQSSSCSEAAEGFYIILVL